MAIPQTSASRSSPVTVQRRSGLVAPLTRRSLIIRAVHLSGAALAIGIGSSVGLAGVASANDGDDDAAVTSVSGSAADAAAAAGLARARGAAASAEALVRQRFASAQGAISGASVSDGVATTRTPVASATASSDGTATTSSAVRSIAAGEADDDDAGVDSVRSLAKAKPSGGAMGGMGAGGRGGGASGGSQGRGGGGGRVRQVRAGRGGRARSAVASLPVTGAAGARTLTMPTGQILGLGAAAAATMAWLSRDRGGQDEPGA